jgi:hypothetical protein
MACFVHGATRQPTATWRNAIRDDVPPRHGHHGIALRVGAALIQFFVFSGVIDMKTFRIVATCAVALIVGQAWAQDQTEPQQTAPAAQDVGGVPQMSRSEVGSSMAVTRQQVYNELIRSEQSGEQGRLMNDLYHGN